VRALLAMSPRRSPRGALSFIAPGERAPAGGHSECAGSEVCQWGRGGDDWPKAAAVVNETMTPQTSSLMDFMATASRQAGSLTLMNMHRR
jgi:hypothetical protein